VSDDSKLADDIRQEIDELNGLVPKILKNLWALIANLRMSYLAFEGDDSLFNAVEKMNHVVTINSSDAIKILKSSLSWAGKFSAERMEDVTNVTISTIAKTSPNDGKNVPSFFLIKLVTLIEQQIAKQIAELEPLKRELNRKLKLLIDLIEKFAEDLNLQAKSPNVPEVTRPFLESRKKNILALLSTIRGITKEVIDKINSVYHNSEDIARILAQIKGLNMDQAVLCELDAQSPQPHS
jgi:methyl-accepting chemotaxis protein